MQAGLWENFKDAAEEKPYLWIVAVACLFIPIVLIVYFCTGSSKVCIWICCDINLSFLSLRLIINSFICCTSCITELFLSLSLKKYTKLLEKSFEENIYIEKVKIENLKTMK